VVSRLQKQKKRLALGQDKIVQMSISNKNNFYHDRGYNKKQNEDLTLDKDLVMEQILQNIHNTPIGQVLQRIASLPELRQQKVLDLRRQITEGKYDVTERLNIALDKVLEDLTT
jgi:anti-sigma28 factor (negative regulator of flagellin synthesis)